MKRLIGSLGILALVAAGAACSTATTTPDPSPILAHRSATALGARAESAPRKPKETVSVRAAR